jgi:RNA-directed DNA polymerase
VTLPSERNARLLDHHAPSGTYLNSLQAASPERADEDIIALGFPDYGPHYEFSKRPGKIIAMPTKHGMKLIEVSAMLPGGIGGGPIVNDRYQVVGVAQRGGHSATG